MNDMWNKLIEECEGNGYTPKDVQRIIMYYEMTCDIDNKLKKLFEEEENDNNNSNLLHYKRK